MSLSTPVHPSMAAPPAASPDAPAGRLGRLWRGREDDPRWARPGLLALLLGTPRSESSRSTT